MIKHTAYLGEPSFVALDSELQQKRGKTAR